VKTDVPPLVVWHPNNGTEKKGYLVIDGNHRLCALQELVKEDTRFQYANVVILHPNTPIDALEKIGQGKSYSLFLYDVI